MKEFRVNLDKIKQARKNKSISLKEMSERLGYESVNGYYYLEIGRIKFQAETLAKTARILELNMNDLFFEN
ncbi:helix-turn-helix domain-containing protein [Cytobacillus firmus]|uniref:helix-turn-helix domain-containing protein n=1 Tax=Cytobacillus firmus TaxID=1399 RepID=UPI0036A64469